jgi:hypothetical protein
MATVWYTRFVQHVDLCNCISFFYCFVQAAGHQFIFESLPRMLTLWFEYVVVIFF